MQFSRLRVSGFKSFCDPVELEIGPGLTGIVGPNGCGKSNIVEALRWVMGESSARGLRGGDMDDVIFGGSSLRSAFDLAEVSVLVRQVRARALAGVASPANDVGREGAAAGLAEQAAPFELEELEVARRIARGTGSAYRINGREARARDVQLVFADAGSGARSPSIIGQGQVGFVVEAKPEERRRLLEDAAGIGGLHSRRREAELKLAATERNLERVLDRIRELDDRLGDLARQAKQAERYRKLQEQIRELESLALLARLQAAREDHAAADTAVLAAAKANAAATAEAGEAEKAHRVVEAALPSAREEAATIAAVVARGQERLQAAEAGRRHREREAALLAAQIDEVEGRLTALDAERRAAVEAIDAKSRAVDEAETELRERRAILTGIEAEEPALADATSREAQNVQALELEEAAGRVRLDGADARLAELGQRLASVEEEVRRLGSVDDDALVEVARRQLDEAKATHAERAADAERARATVDEREKASDEAAGLLEQARETAAQAQVRLQSAAARLESGRAAHAALDERRRMLGRDRERAAERLQAIEAEMASLDLDARQSELAHHDAEVAALEGAVPALEAERDEADRRLRSAQHARDERQEELAALDREIERRRVEREALIALQPETAAAPVLDRLRVPEDRRRALAAALGDDLLHGTDEAAAAHWAPSAVSEVPPLPEGCEPLTDAVSGFDLLRPRLSMTGVCADAATARRLQPALRPGQRLVTAEGGLWRWDGFVHLPGTDDPSERRLLQRQRLRDLDGELAAMEERRVDLQQAAASATSALDEARIRAEDTAARLAEAAQKLDATQRTIERLRHTLSTDEGAALRLADEQARARTEEGECRTQLEGLDRTAGEDVAALDAAWRDARAHAAEADRALDAARGAREEAERSLRDSRQASATATSRAAEALAAVSQAELTHQRRHVEASARKAHRATAADDLARDRLRFTAERDACREERETLERHLHDLTGRKAEASEGHRARATALDALRRRRAETAAAIAGLDERRLAGRAEITRLEEVIARADATKRDLGARRTALDEQRAAGRATDAEDGSMEAVAEELRRREAALGRAKAALAAMEEDHRRCAEHRRAAEANAARRHEALSLAEAEAARTAEVLAEIETFARTRLARAADVLLADEALQAELAAADMSELEEKLLRLRAARERIGPVNLRAAAEVEERGAEAAALRREEGELRAAVERLKRGIGALDREARERLKEIFEKVDEHFRRLFVQLFGGGKAHLRLTNLDDPLAAGLELDAMPPGKKLQNISLLSGGEKTLTALALVFAFFLAQPSPLCVLDEVDAALDDANVERFVDLMEGIARDTGTRFIVVTHHPFTMARMDRLFGVTMIERGVSRLVSVALDEAVELRASA